MIVCLAIGLAGMPLEGIAESAEGAESVARPRIRRTGVGVGMVMNQSPYERGSARVVVIPALTYIGTRVSLLGTSVQLRLGSLGLARIRAQARYSFERFDTNEARLIGLDTRHDTVMGGAGIRMPLPRGVTVDLVAETDLLDRHGGQRATAELSRPWRLAGVNITPSAGVEWLGAATAAHRYGVSATEARDDRPAYRPGSTHSARLGLSAQVRLGDAITLISSGAVTFLDPAIQDSPLVVRDALFSAFMALSYNF